MENQQATINNNNKSVNLTEEEIKEFNKLTNDIRLNIFDLGLLYHEKIEVDNKIKELSDKEQKLRSFAESIPTLQNNFMDKLGEKYGEGKFDPDNMRFIKD